MSAGDANAVLCNDMHSFVSDGDQPLELLVVGMAREEGPID